MIGADFEKIHFVLFGLDLVEPMALITDLIMGSISVYFGIKVGKIKSEHPFYQYWKWFFLIFGIGSIIGGFGHVMYNYWGVPGKFLSWLSGPVSVYCLEQGMISLYPDRKIFGRLKLASFWKFVAVITAWILVLVFVDLSEKPSRGFLPIAINTIVGVSLTAGILGMIYFRKGLSPLYKYFYLGVLIMLPSAFVFLLKINLHQWFDKNDLSHILLTLGIIYFYIGIKKLDKAGFHKDNYL
ncbi:MAG: hypothetical protein R2780_13085 [Crocinitomicaceae bacterium]|nr:hypothetical protein [Crocinitomicaceae bacterium]